MPEHFGVCDVNRIIKRAGIAKINALGKKLTAHSFRHTFATRMAEQIGNNPFILKELMGHSKITTTEIYCQPQAPDLVMRMPDLSNAEVMGVVEKAWWKKEKTASREAV
ncbi:MAG: site-specific integrase [Candidatus Sumerlaeia bacterium]